MGMTCLLTKNDNSFEKKKNKFTYKMDKKKATWKCSVKIINGKRFRYCKIIVNSLGNIMECQ